MIRRCIIHIGPHKTGSSSIQHTLYYDLSDPNFQYADLGRINHGPAIRSLFTSAPKRLSQHRQRKRSAEQIEKYNQKALHRLLRAVTESAAPNLILSGEAMGGMRRGELRRLCKFMGKHFDEIKIVGYVRPQRALMQSMYQQMIKTRAARIDFTKLYIGYRERFEKLDIVFGRENTMLFRFAADDFPGGDVVRHFFGQLGIAAPPQFHRINESLSKQAVQVLYAYHKYSRGIGRGPGTPALKTAVAKTLSELKGDKFRFSSEIVRPVLDSNRDDIAWAEDRIGASLAELDDDDTGTIRDETDLLAIDDSTIDSLMELVKPGDSQPQPGEDRPRTAARLVEVLAESIRSEREANRNKKTFAKKRAADVRDPV